MAHLTSEQADILWRTVDSQRLRTADLLASLSPEQWDHQSLCDGWTVRHVAAHLTTQQDGLGTTLAFMARNPRLLRNLEPNAAGRATAILLAEQLSTDEIVAKIRAMVGSRRHIPIVSPLESLTDAIVHGQDIAVPLEIELTMDPVGSEMAAGRIWDNRGTWLARMLRDLPLDGYRFVATDVDWERGEGPEVRGPIGQLLLLLCGRPVALPHLEGSGADQLRTRVAV